ncbi:MAG: hypothetical protein Ct9H300mP7_6350 [Verrucomicrobiota bacterium]|nr:MAG: hypothetical protein Ct9H300mP7_6350 [Verrucomicrobiota bacterium]
MGFNYDPSHLGYQGVDYVQFIYKFADRINHVHMKDAFWHDHLCDAGVFGGHTDFTSPTGIGTLSQWDAGRLTLSLSYVPLMTLAIRVRCLWNGKMGVWTGNMVQKNQLNSASE